MKAIECKNISKSFSEGEVIHDFSYTFEYGKLYVIYGESGSGKSTLLNLIGNLDKPNRGTISYYCDDKLDNSNQVTLFRNRIGYLFQNYALLDDQTVKQNLMISLKYVVHNDKDYLMKQALNRVGLENCLNKKIFTLSGGEQQRVAFARVLLKENNIILADEPSGNLDKKNAERIFRIFEELKDENKVVIIVTHDAELLEKCDEKIVLLRITV